jgi:ribosomal protein S18 acetylase RimI-like enzyme
VTLVEWAALAPETLHPLYQQEEARWRTNLGWDTTAAWATIEQARVSWGLPGIVCCDATNRIVGWTFYLPRDHELELGGIVADAPEVTAALLEHVSQRSGGLLSGFIYARASGLHEACAAAGMQQAPYAYMVRDTNRAPYNHPTRGIRAWRNTDAPATAALLQGAYAGAGRLFARNDSPAEWRGYLDNLVSHSGCGTLRPDLSRLVEIDGQLAAIALVTALGVDMAHLAQLAVAPAYRRSGVGRVLLGEALKVAHAAGYRELSLLVAEDNAPARQLYASWDFRPRAKFVWLRGRGGRRGEFSIGN